MFFLVLYVVKMKAMLSLAALLVVARTSCRHLCFLNQVHAWFLKIAFVWTSVCVSWAIKNYSREMKSE